MNFHSFLKVAIYLISFLISIWWRRSSSSFYVEQMVVNKFAMMISLFFSFSLCSPPLLFHIFFSGSGFDFHVSIELFYPSSFINIIHRLDINIKQKGRKKWDSNNSVNQKKNIKQMMKNQKKNEKVQKKKSITKWQNMTITFDYNTHTQKIYPFWKIGCTQKC